MALLLTIIASVQKQNISPPLSGRFYGKVTHFFFGQRCHFSYFLLGFATFLCVFNLE